MYLTPAERDLCARIAQATDARRPRMEAAALSRKSRDTALSDAKALIRKHGVQTPDELLSALQCVHAAIDAAPGTDVRAMGNRLLELICDFDGEMHEPTPELSGCDPRGELDVFTQRRTA